MAKELTKKEIYERMVEWRNLKKLHKAQGVRIEHLRAENKKLKDTIVVLETENTTLKKELEDIKYQLTGIQTMLYKKKRTAKDIMKDNDDDTPPKQPRNKETYKRPIPKEDEVTKVVYHRFKRKQDGSIRLRTYYVEDIPLDIKKVVEKHVVEQYFDKERRTWVSQDTLPSATVVLGDNIRILVATLITIQRLSFTQVRTLLSTLFHIDISDGEIAHILAKEAQTLQPAEQALLSRIQDETSVHMDETRYDIHGQPHYAWNITGGESGDTLYRLGVSRGKGVAEALKGESESVLISDDYGAYRHLATHHQLCWAHLIRKFRDLAQYKDFDEAQKEAVQETYQDIKNLYHETVAACSNPDPQSHITPFTNRLSVIAAVDSNDPKPVARLKTTLMRNVAKYFTCLSFPMTALTNNPAEQALRHIVLKRKVSFGCKSAAGASALGTLFSVLLSLHRKDPATYFERYGELRRV